MSKTVACVIARTVSTRLPRKVMLEVLPGCTMLDYMLQRLKLCERIDAIYLCTSDESVDDELVAVAARNGVQLYRGSGEKVIERMLDVGEATGADHSGYADPAAIESNDEAWRLGARLFEKHITVSEGVQRVDYESAVGPEKIAEIVQRLKALEKAGAAPADFDGNDAGLAEMTEAEQKYRQRTKVVVAGRALGEGHALTEGDLALKMIDQNGGSFDLDELVGKTLATSVTEDELITLGMLQGK